MTVCDRDDFDTEGGCETPSGDNVPALLVFRTTNGSARYARGLPAQQWIFEDYGLLLYDPDTEVDPRIPKD